jgi:hypothetical protein
MSTYTGNPVSAHTPATAPDPAALPILTLPASGDPATAASVMQAFQVLADYIAWEKVPKAKASAWIQAIKQFKDANGQGRFAVDHLGFPAGKLVAWQEDWSHYFTYPTAPGAGALFGRWIYRITTAGIVVPAWVGAIGCLELDAGNGSGGGLTNVEAAGPVTAVNIAGGATDADIAISMQFDVYSNLPNSGQSEQAFGLALNGSGSGSGPFTAQVPEAVAIVKPGSLANWQVYTKVAAGAVAYVDTGISATSGNLTRFRIERIGANASDDGTARAIVYANGAIVANVAIMIRQPTPFFQQWSNTGDSRVRIGPVDVRANTWPGDVLL